MSWLFPEFKFKWLVDESKKHLPLELDFEHEGRNAEKITHFFKKFPFVKVGPILMCFCTVHECGVIMRLRECCMCH